MNLDSCKFWQINEIYIGEEIEHGEDYTHDFLRWVEDIVLKPGNLYLFGFERNLLCEVEEITSEYCKRSPGYDDTRIILHLKKVVNLDEQTVEIKKVRENNFTMEVKNEIQKRIVGGYQSSSGSRL